MIKKIWIITALLWATAPLLLAQREKKTQPVTINGTISGTAGVKLRFQKYVASGMQNIDSAVSDAKGRFSFTHNVNDTGFYRIMKTETDFIALCIQPSEKISITAQANNINKTYTVKGSVFSQHMNEFAVLVNSYVKEKDTLSARFKKCLNAGQKLQADALSAQMQTAYDGFLKKRDAFITKYPKSPALFVVVSHLSPQSDYDKYKKIQVALQTSLGGQSPFTQYMNSIIQQLDQQRLEEEKKKQEQERIAKIQERIAPGKEFPDIVMSDSLGNPLKLSSLRGKVVLVDFWASWCGPCRQENPNVVRAYQKYRDKGFTVYSVSLDTKRNLWLYAIKKDGLVWPNHVSELKGWATSILPDFGISGIPFTVLIDREGKVVQTHLRGPALEMKLQEIFGF